MARWVTAFVFFLLAGTVSATTVSNGNCQNCADFLGEAEILAGGEWRILTEGEDIIFLYRAVFTDIDSVWTCCGIQEDLSLLDAESKVWGLRYHIPRLDEAIIGFSFSEIKQRERLFWSGYQLWRGDNAPAAPPYAAPIMGRIAEARFMGIALNEARGVMVYYPPNYDENLTYPVIYAVDGQSLVIYAPYLESLIVAGDIPPTLMIGTYSSDYRAEEYLPHLDRQRFTAHERFFTEEVRHWAENFLGASRQQEERAVFGFSNGGVFAATMALLHPNIYGVAFPFSAGMNPFEVYPDAEIDSGLRLYFTAGTLEAGFSRNTRCLAERFAQANADVIFNERVAGHDFYMWQEEFYHAVKWAFAD